MWVAVDVYGAAPDTGRGGWSWYTGSAAWMYRLGLEGILGIRRCPGRACVIPTFPVGLAGGYEISDWLRPGDLPDLRTQQEWRGREGSQWR